jgi:LacI family transcriptional regulator
MPRSKEDGALHPGKPVTAVELARMLGVSLSTVSFVMNGHAEKYRIPAKTAKRVLDAAKQHRYVPNPHARRLRSSKSGMIGVVLGNFKMDWVEMAMQGMQKVIDATDYVPFVATHGFDAERNRKELQSSLQRRDEGLIAFPMPDCDELYHSIIQAGVPLVFIGEEMPGLEDVSAVVWDSESAAEAAVRHLVGLGRRRIAFLGVDYPGLGTLHRFKAYCRVLRECGLELRESWIARPSANLPPREMIGMALDQFFADPQHAPDAIFALNDGLALPAMEELAARGISVPGDVALIGLQNLPLSSHPAISLSTVEEPVEAMGEAAARILLDLISGKTKAPVRLVIPTGGVLARRSTIG